MSQYLEFLSYFIINRDEESITLKALNLCLDKALSEYAQPSLILMEHYKNLVVFLTLE